MQIDAAQVAVLAERVDRMLMDYQELRSLIMAQSLTLSNISIVQTKIEEHERKFDRVFSATRGSDQRLGILEKSSHVQAWTWKLTGSALICCLGLVGWGWGQIESFKHTDAALERRTLLLEYRLGIERPVAEGEK